MFFNVSQKIKELKIRIEEKKFNFYVNENNFYPFLKYNFKINEFNIELKIKEEDLKLIVEIYVQYQKTKRNK